MIDSTKLTEIVTEYINKCETDNHKPTYKGLSNALEVSPQTIANVAAGSYNGKPYTKHPHATRCFDNKDFEIIQAVYAPRTE